MRDTGIELKRFLDEAEGGAYDLPPMQRALCVRPAFSVRLIDSLYRGYRVGSMLIWEPPVGQRPSAGRYQGLEGHPRWWILDGQQRGTSYAGAFGRRPAWLPEELWTSVGGPELEVAVRFTSTGNVQFRTHRPGRARHVRLADLVAGAGGEVRLLLEETGYSPTDVLVERALDLRAGLLRYVLPIEWLAADWADAAENFIRRNPDLKPEERSLCSLSIAFEELQREHIDALVRTARDAGFATTLDRRQLNLVLQDFLPHGVRQGRWAEGDAVSRAMERTEQSVTEVIAFLHRHGITGDALLWSPPAARVLCALFDRFPQAVSSPFTWQWLAHAAAGQFYPGGPYASRPRQDVRGVLAAASFEEVIALLAGHGSPGPPPRLRAEELVRPSASRRSLLGAAGTLYAMACAHRVCGPVVDFADSAMVFPDPRMRPRLLWPGMGSEMSLAAWALLGEDSAGRVGVGGGWGRPVFEDLDVPPGRLAAHQLTLPPGGAVVLPVEQQLKLRAEAMADAVNVFLETVGPLDVQDGGL